MRKFLFWPYQVYEWLILMPLVGILTFIFGSLTAIFSILVNPRFGSRVFGMTWAKLLAWSVPIFVTVEGGGNANRKLSYVVVCNHQSLFDIPVVYGWLDLDLKWVIKQELRKLPGLGIGCEKAGHIFVDRKDSKKARSTIEKALDRLGNGIGILFYVEGTRSLDGRLLPFKKSAFRVAIEQQLPVLPVTLVGTRDILPAKSLKAFPGRVRMVVHPAIETRGLTLSQTGELLNAAKIAIASALPGELS
jgi:1-acyl-sn-glycerol-3-phosphate acyltransferase